MILDDADAVAQLGHLVAENLKDLGGAGLAAAVARVARHVRDVDGRGARVDDDAALGRVRRPRAQQVEVALDVDLEALPPVGRVGPRDRVQVGHVARVGAQDVDRGARAVDEGLQRRGDRGGVYEVRDVDEDSGAWGYPFDGLLGLEERRFSTTEQT